MTLLILRTKTGQYQATQMSEAPDEITAPAMVPERLGLGKDEAFVDTTFRKVLDVRCCFDGADCVLYEEKV